MLSNATKWIFLSAASTCSALSHAQTPEPRRDFRARITLDLDGDRKLEIVDIDAQRDATLQIRRNNRVLWRGVQKRVRPWMLQIGDVDGDGKKEIALGTWKSTRLFPKVHRTVSIYRFDGRACKPLWLGSHLSNPYLNFRLVDFDGDGQSELVALEVPPNQTQRQICVYRWDYFGFRFLGRSRAFDNLQLLDSAKFLDSRRGVRVQIGTQRQFWTWPHNFPLR